MYINIKIHFFNKCTLIFLYLIPFFEWWVYVRGVFVRQVFVRWIFFRAVFVRGVFVRGVFFRRVFVLIPLDLPCWNNILRYAPSHYKENTGVDLLINIFLEIDPHNKYQQYLHAKHLCTNFTKAVTECC